METGLEHWSAGEGRARAPRGGIRDAKTLVVFSSIAMTRVSLGEATEEFLRSVFENFGGVGGARAGEQDKPFAMGEVLMAKGMLPPSHGKFLLASLEWALP